MNDTPVDIEMVTAQGIAVATAWVGDVDTSTTPIVWLHGLGGSSTVSFANVATVLASSGWRSLLIDLPGHGHSEVPENWPYTIEAMASLVMEVVAGLADGPVKLFGHSMGGSVAIICAHHFPGAIERLIVAEPNLDPATGTISPRIARRSEDHFVTQGYPALPRATRLLADKGDIESRDWLQTLEMASPMALHRCATSLMAHRSLSFGEQLAALSIPVATIRGERSSFETIRGDDSLTGYVVPDAGHQMFAGNPGAFVEILDHILRRT